jgi:hypothetical protein
MVERQTALRKAVDDARAELTKARRLLDTAERHYRIARREVLDAESALFSQQLTELRRNP